MYWTMPHTACYRTDRGKAQCYRADRGKAQMHNRTDRSKAQMHNRADRGKAQVWKVSAALIICKKRTTLRQIPSGPHIKSTLSALV